MNNGTYGNRTKIGSHPRTDNRWMADTSRNKTNLIAAGGNVRATKPAAATNPSPQHHGNNQFTQSDISKI